MIPYNIFRIIHSSKPKRKEDLKLNSKNTAKEEFLMDGMDSGCRKEISALRVKYRNYK